MPLWTQARGAYNKLMGGRVATFWREWGKFAWAIPFGAADIAISQDKRAAIGANIADISVAWALRKRRGVLPFALPTVAYAATRAGISVITGLGERNKPINPIKGHDAGRWGREQTFVTGDFEPGASWKGLWSGIRRLFTRTPKADWAKIEDIVNPLVALERETGRRAAEFIKRAPIEKVLTPEVNFPAQYFGKVGAGRTLTMEAAGLQEAVPMITAPEAMKAGQLVGRLGEVYKGTAVHEIAEAAYAFSPFAMTKRGARFLGLYGHYSPDVMRAQGLFMQRIGLTPKELRAIYGEMPGFRWMKEGWKQGNKAVNPIKGHDAGHWGRETTFTGDFQPGASWIGQAIKRGVSWQKIAQAAFKMGGPAAKARTTDLTARRLGRILEEAYHVGGQAEATRLIRSEFKLVTEEGQSFLRGAVIDRGGFKQVQMIYGTSPGAIERGVLAEALPGQIGTASFASGQIGGVPRTIFKNQTKFTADEIEEAVWSVRDALQKGTKAVQSSHPFAYEMAIQKRAREIYGEVVPGIMGKTKTGFIQEYAGVQLPKTYETKGFEAAMRHLDKAAAHGGVAPVHLDLHAGNILRKGAQMHIVDWGLAAETAVTPKMLSGLKKGTDMYYWMPAEASVQQAKGLPKLQDLMNKLQAPGGNMAAVQAQQDVVKETVARRVTAAERQRVIRRKAILNERQKAAQPLPLQLNSMRRMSHGVVRRTRRTTR